MVNLNQKTPVNIKQFVKENILKWLEWGIGLGILWTIYYNFAISAILQLTDLNIYVGVN